MGYPLLYLKGAILAGSSKISDLSYGHVDIWFFSLLSSKTAKQKFASIFSADETKRLGEIKLSIVANEFIGSRGCLREILSKYLPLNPSELVFEYGSRKKPFLALKQNSEQIKFNLSHSSDMAVLAVTKGMQIGVAIELLRKLDGAEKISSRFFAPSETFYLKSFKGKELECEFFKLWTAKESILKAHGGGISDGLSKWVLSLEHYPFIEIVAKPEKCSWCIVPIACQNSNYITALAGPTSQFSTLCIYSL